MADRVLAYSSGAVVGFDAITRTSALARLGYVRLTGITRLPRAILELGRAHQRTAAPNLTACELASADVSLSVSSLHQHLRFPGSIANYLLRSLNVLCF